MIVVRAVLAAVLVLWAAGIYVQATATESKERWLLYGLSVALAAAAMVLVGLE